MSTKDTLFMVLSVLFFFIGMIVFSGRLEHDGLFNAGSFMNGLSLIFCFLIGESTSGEVDV
tara:strand:- start:1662 stop:1844 length:183 start_codon:yes stop_codon:yes gene_type:complete